MKKRITVPAMLLIMCLAIMPVTAAAAGSGSLSLDKASYEPNSEIIAAVSGITQQMVDDQAYVSIYRAGAAHSEYMSWHRPEAGSSQLGFTAPSELGAYEMRLYRKDYDYTDDSFVMSVPFTVSMQKQGKISLEKNAYQAEQEISVTVTEITQEMEKSEAFVSIYKKGAKHNEYGVYEYVKAGSSVVVLKAPNLNGEFEMRLYGINHNYSDESFVTSVPFTLSGAVEKQYSDWAKTEIEKADEMGLIPDSLKNADLTKSINRAEFCELALLLYEKSTGKNPLPVSPNPFTDTANPQILKALGLGITQGTSTNTFSPHVLINREQCATMLFRTLKAINPGGSYSIEGVAKFPDEKNISSFALEGAKFMSKLGIIKGDSSGNFMPKATTEAQTAAGYGMATREAAILMSVRSYDKMEGIISDAGAPQPDATRETASQSAGGASIIGKWSYGMTGAMYNMSTGSFNFGMYGVAAEYNFNSDGTFVETISSGSGSVVMISGNYTVSTDKLTLTFKSSKSSSDFGNTWTEGNVVPPASYYYKLDVEDGTVSLRIGLEDAALPLDESNSVSYSYIEQ